MFLGLLAYFNGNSKFSIRYAKTRWRDRIGKAVFTKDFFAHGWSRPELNDAIKAGLVMANQYKDPQNGMLRSAIVFTADDEPQITPFKRLINGDVTFKGFVKDVISFIKSLIAGTILVTAFIVFMLLFFAYLSRLH